MTGNQFPAISYYLLQARPRGSSLPRVLLIAGNQPEAAHAEAEGGV